MRNGQAGFRQRRSFTCWLVTGRKLLYSITDQTCKWETSLCRHTLVKLDKYFSESLGMPTIQKLHAYDGFICLVIHWRIVTDNYQYQSETSWHTTLSPILVYDFFLVPNSSLTSKQWTFKSWLNLWHLLYVFSSSKLSTSNYHSTNNSHTDWLLHQCAENKNQLKTNRWH